MRRLPLVSPFDKRLVGWHGIGVDTLAAIERLRRQRRSGPQIARELGLPRSTVGVVLRRLGLGRLSALETKPAIVRYFWACASAASAFCRSAISASNCRVRSATRSSNVAQITGSIIGTSLLGLGLAIVVGGVTRERQTFKRERAGLLSSLLLLSVIALLLPAVFDLTDRGLAHALGLAVSEEALSLVVSGVLLLLYAGNLVFTLVTHRDVFSTGEEDAEAPAWPVWLCLLVLTTATVGAALEAT